MFLAATKQLCEWSCLSVSRTISLCSCHRIIMTFSGVITIDNNNSYGHAEGHRSKVKVAEIKTNFVPIQAFLDRNSSFIL